MKKQDVKKFPLTSLYTKGENRFSNSAALGGEVGLGGFSGRALLNKDSFSQEEILCRHPKQPKTF